MAIVVEVARGWEQRASELVAARVAVAKNNYALAMQKIDRALQLNPRATDALLRERSAIYTAAERPLGFSAGALNNVSLASNMTYSRYYPQVEEAFAANGRDLARTVALFRKVDAARPAVTSVQKQQRIEDVRSVEFLRAYESAVIDAIRAALRGTGTERLRKN